MKNLLEHYLVLENMMMSADRTGDEALADKLRDKMDSIWYQLSEEARDALNARGMLNDTTKQ